MFLSMQKTTKSHQEILQTNEECKSNILKEFYENRNILKDSIDILKIYGHEISHLQQKNENLLKNIQNKTSQNYAMKNELRRSNETMTALRNEFLKFVEINSDWESITEK
jgi:flagellar motility protein MotE (MotC chaperone)